MRPRRTVDEYPDGQPGCHLCHDGVPRSLQDAIDHIRVLHPDVYSPPERWSDGGLVVTDETLCPGDFR